MMRHLITAASLLGFSALALAADAVGATEKQATNWHAIIMFCIFVALTMGITYWAASRTKHTYLSAQYRRLAARRGTKRALVAVGHTILVMIFHLLKHGTTYAELGATYFDRLDTERLTRTLVRRLERLGHEVVLKSKESAA